MRESDQQKLRANRRKPYVMVGAGRLSAAVWKGSVGASRYRYRFNIFRMSAKGSVGQEFRPADVVDLLKLTRVIAAVLADDGCVSARRRRELLKIADLIEKTTTIDSD